MIVASWLDLIEMKEINSRKRAIDYARACIL